MFLSLPPLVFHIFIFYKKCCVANFLNVFIYRYLSLVTEETSQTLLSSTLCSWWYFKSVSEVMLMSSVTPVLFFCSEILYCVLTRWDFQLFVSLGRTCALRDMLWGFYCQARTSRGLSSLLHWQGSYSQRHHWAPDGVMQSPNLTEKNATKEVKDTPSL